MFAVKATRALTGRTRIAKFEGAYHGGYDWVEVSEYSSPDSWGAGGPAATPFARGTPQSVLDEVVVLPFNDTQTTVRLLERHGADLACVVFDPMPSRAGLIPPGARRLSPPIPTSAIPAPMAASFRKPERSVQRSKRLVPDPLRRQTRA